MDMPSDVGPMQSPERRRVLLLGRGGLGKTTFLSALASALVEDPRFSSVEQQYHNQGPFGREMLIKGNMNVDGHLHSSEWCISMSIEGTSTDDWAVSRNIDSLMQEDDTPPFDVAICFLAPKGDLTDDIDVIELLAPHMVVIPVIAASDTIPLADVQARRTRLSRDLASRAISLAPLPGYPSGIATMYAGDTAGECPSDDSRDSPIALARLITDEGLWDGSVAPQEKARERRKAGKLKAMFGAGRANKAGIVAISLAVILAAFAIAMYSSLVRQRRGKLGR